MASGCERMNELALAATEGRPASPEDSRFRTDHLAACDACRAEDQAVSLLRFREDEPHFPLDELSRQRLVYQVVAAANAPEEEEERSGLWEWLGRWRFAVATSLAAAAVMAFLVVRLGPAPRAVPATVLLAEAQSYPVGGALAEGSLVKTAKGEVALALGEKVVVMLSPGSAARLDRLQAGRIELFLESGRVVASVVPDSHPGFSVISRAGRVEVTGTVFSVEADGNDTRLRVLRGAVKAIPRGRLATRVEALQSLELGAGKVRALTGDEQRKELAAFTRVSLLEAGEAASVQVRSRPLGATVSIDGQILGATPLQAEVKSGHRHLLVSAAGHLDREEWLDLHAGAVTLRDYDLPETAVAAVETPAPAPVSQVRSRPVRAHKVPLAELVRDAQEARVRHDWEAAAEAYREMISQHPTSASAENARVSLGELLLDHLSDLEGALRSCDGYLKRNPAGSIANEALLCRINAERALGRFDDEKQSIREFLQAYPGSPSTPVLKRRLAP